jgi:hypothetical protein
MNCDEAKGRLGPFYDGELNVAEHDLVAAHIEHCQSCANELAALEQLDRNSRQLRSLDPPPELGDRIAERLAAGRAVPLARPRVVTRRQFAFAAGVLATSAVGGLLASTFVRHRSPAASSGISPLPEGASAVDPILVNLSRLSPHDRRLAESQETCAAEGCDVRLGAEGPPVKVVLLGMPVFCCSRECELWARGHSGEAIAKAQGLVHRHQARSAAGTSR